MKTQTFTLIMVLMFAIFFAGCKKENLHNSDDSEFCTFISKENYNGTGAIINNFLKGQSADLTESQKLDQLKAWLKSKNCVADAEVLCTSCIDTNPAQSELKVWFIIEGKLSENVLDIIMDNPMRFGKFHVQ